MGLRKQNSWLKYAKLCAYKTKPVWPPQFIKTTTYEAKSTTTFFQFTKTCTCRRLTLIVKRTHKLIQQIVGSFLYYGRSIELTIIKKPQHIGDARICTNRKQHPVYKFFSQLLCLTSWCQNTIFCIQNDPTSPLRHVIPEWDQGK